MIYAAGFLQRLAQRTLLRCFLLRHLFRRKTLGEMRINQSPIAWRDARKAGQGLHRCRLVTLVPGGVRGVVAGGERGQPQVKIAVQRFFGEAVDLRRQAQRFGIEARQRRPFFRAGNALQPATARTMLLGRCCCHAQPGITAKGAEQDTGRLFDFLQRDCRFGVMATGSAGHHLVPEFADVLFHQCPRVSSSATPPNWRSRCRVAALKPASFCLARSPETHCRSAPCGLSRCTVAQADVH